VSECLQRGQLPRAPSSLWTRRGSSADVSYLNWCGWWRQAAVVLSSLATRGSTGRGSFRCSARDRAVFWRSRAELNEIRRQDPARGKDVPERLRIAQYREAVEAAASGDLECSLERLETLGAVVECSVGEQRARLSEAYAHLAERGESAIVVSQTRAEVRALNEAIRTQLRERGLLIGSDAGDYRAGGR
jgi:hypothetical protein